ncbi:hypothetical protein [Oceanospirillum sp. RT-1-3]|uniref:hypothetical protein n=1 Tax=unclassified Halobacteriovorax TaxID=2639665 RepID=UPI00399AA952
MKYFSILTLCLLLTNPNNELRGQGGNSIKNKSKQANFISRIRLNTRRGLLYYPFIPRYMIA